MNRFSVIIILFVFASCINPRERDHKILCRIDCSGLCADTSEFLTTHLLDVQCGGTFLPLRNRILTEEELKFSQRNSAEAKVFNEKVIIENLNNGAWLKVLKADTLGYHYVQVIDRTNEDESDVQRGVKGYIVSQYCDLPTTRQIQNVIVPHFSRTEKSEIMSRFLDHHIPKGETLAYAFSYVSNEADNIQVFSFAVNGLNSIRYKIKVVWGQESSLLLEGRALLTRAYLDSLERPVSVYTCEKDLGYRLELHMCLSSNFVFVKYLNPEIRNAFNSFETPVPSENVMHRFK